MSQIGERQTLCHNLGYQDGYRQGLQDGQTKQVQASFKAGAKAMYDLLTDSYYSHIEMKEDRYPEYLRKLRGLLCVL